MAFAVGVSIGLLFNVERVFKASAPIGRQPLRLAGSFFDERRIGFGVRMEAAVHEALSRIVGRAVLAGPCPATCVGPIYV